MEFETHYQRHMILLHTERKKRENNTRWQTIETHKQANNGRNSRNSQPFLFTRHWDKWEVQSGRLTRRRKPRTKAAPPFVTAGLEAQGKGQSRGRCRSSGRRSKSGGVEEVEAAVEVVVEVKARVKTWQ